MTRAGRLRNRPLRVMATAVAALAASVVAVVPLHGHAAAATPNAVQTENALPGDPTWDDFASIAQQDAISGYASPISVNHGSPVDLYVTTTAASFTIDVFRMGWYGGAGARKIAALGTFPGVHQAIPAPDPKTGLVECHWNKTTTINIPSTWVSGVYLAKLAAANGNKSFIYFVVRNDGGTEAVDFQTSVTTYQAYNLWGGVSLYDNTTNKSVYPYAHATKVSFDRPFDPLDSNGSGHFLAYEYPFIRWAEKNGYDMTYTTDIDTHTNVNPLTNHKAFLSVGHDEYWTKGMRDNVQNAINSGVNAAFFSANTAYWQIRLEPDAAGNPNRTEVGYKDVATFNQLPGPDPQYGVNNAIVTTRWRDDPLNLPENGLIGVMYQDQVQKDYPYVVSNASSWVFAGTGFTNGTSIPGIVGYEYDKTWNNGATPPGLTVLSNSPVVGCCEGSGNSTSNSTIYTAASGARVFASGTIQWSWGLDNYSASYANAGIQKTTANILDAFGSGAATAAPAVTMSPTALGFGSQRVGTTSGSQSVTLTNSGTAPLSIASVGLAGANAADYAQTNTCPVGSTLGAGASCSLAVTFTPTASGSRSASVTIADNAVGSPQTVSLTGTGTAPGVSLSPTALTFPTQVIGTTSTSQTVTVSNTGTAPLTINGIGLSGSNSGDFAQTNTCPAAPVTLATGVSCSVSVTFTPGATGTRTGSLTITDDAAGSPQSVPLSGTGATTLAPAVRLSPTALTFPGQTTGTTSSAQSVTLTNTGTAPLTISSIGVTGTNAVDFSSSSTCATSPTTIAAGASCTISVTFAPGTAGTRTASVTVTDDAADSPQAVSLTGTGVSPAPAVQLSPTSLTFPSQTVNTSSAAQTVKLTNTGTAPLSISSINVTGTNSSDFSQSNTCPSWTVTLTQLASGASCTISVTFAPTVTGSRAAAVTIQDDAADSPQTVALAGTGAAVVTSIFSDGFESGTLPGAWTATKVSTGNTLGLDTTVRHSGSYALKAVKVKGSSRPNAYVSKTIAGQTALDVRGYYYLSAPVNWGAVPIMSLYGSGQFLAWVNYYVDPSTPTFTVYNGGNGATYQCSKLPTLNSWHSIELQYVVSTSTTGSFSLWLDGVQVCGATGIRTSPGPASITQVVAGADTADNTVGLTVNLDDVVISKNYVGA